MSFVKTVVSRPTTIFVFFVLLLMLGAFAWVNLPLDLTPEINPPYLVVFTTYAGASPEEVERVATRTVEAAVSSVSGLESITSTSSSGSSMVMMEYTYGTDLVDATNSVRDALDRIRNFLPDGVDPPTIFKFNPSMMPIMSLQLTGNRSPEELREFAENTIVPRLEQTPGVATASVMGGRNKIIRVEIPQSRLEAYNLTVTGLQQMLAAQNQQIAAGSIIEGGLTYILTTMGEYTSIDQIKNTVISYKGGGYVNGVQELPRQVYLRDIADITESYRDETSVVYVNGSPAVQLSIQKQSGKNSVQTVKSLREKIDQLAKELPPDVEISELFNTADQIETSINQVANSALTGAILAIIVLFVFLRSIQPTLIIAISIPVSIVVTLMLMYFAGLTLNLLTLAGLVLGVGMLVDNSIVILENIYHYREKGAKLGTAAVIGTQEMIVAIIGSTLTTICVFAPLVMFQGLLEMAGELFAGLAFTVVISLAVSLLVAVFLVPVLASHYLPLVTRKQRPLTGAFVPLDNTFAKFFAGLENAYRKAVSRVLRFRWAVIAVLLLLLAGSIYMIPKIGWVFMPQEDEDSVTINVMMPIGTPMAETEAVLHQLQTLVEREIRGYETLTLNAGGGGGLMAGGSNSGSLQIGLPDLKDRIDTADTIRDKMRTHMNEFPGAMIYFSGGSGGMGMMMGGSAVDIVLRTDDLAKGKQIADRISQLLRERIPEVTEPRVDLMDGLPQIEIQLDRERMYALGLSAFTVGNEIRAAVDGITATRYKSGGHDYDVVLMLAEADRSTRPALDHIFVNSQMTSQRIPLSSFATYVEGTGPMSIARENQSRTIHVTAGAQTGTKLNELETKVRALITREIPAENDVIIEISGGNAEMMKMMQRFVLIIAVAVALVFGIMAALFESFRDPFIVILTIPLSVIGIVAIYLITGDIFNILTAVGLLVLVGVIVNNGIVLVDYTNMLRKRGLSLHDACVEAAGNRLRPILMTTLTTVLALVPMAFFPGEGSEMTGPIGKTVFGGLSFGTLMTLFLMPSIYYIINKRSDERDARADARRERIAAGISRKQAKRAAQGYGPNIPGETGGSGPIGGVSIAGFDAGEAGL
ncbi:MAG: efflux RND transporter permease subunit [Spirochaetaceae bacterium]|jgi:HAE1 family hydrophobic/amphiphilic exporter-1|nr:efflux RND transporter permease subunit [Spirochaetaceae bacterium]